jgi:hypothetical protein
MDKKSLTAILSAFIICFYMLIILYILFGVLPIYSIFNLLTALVFELIGFAILLYLILSNILAKRIKTGYFIPLIMATVIYTIVLDYINISLIKTLPNVWFILVNLILVFVYSVIAIPMYIMGRQ